MRKISVVGAGKIGQAIATMLARAPEYELSIIDQNEAAIALLKGRLPVRGHVIDLNEGRALDRALADADAVLCAAPHHLTAGVAHAAARAHAHYFDLTEDVAVTREVKRLAEGAERAFVPQCGLAPGFVSIAAASLAQEFDTLDTLKLRVGALPEYPSNALGYNLTWSTEGLINEYDQPCEAIIDGAIREIAPLEGLETLVIDAVRYEAFNTSGGLGGLCDAFRGRVRQLDYKSIRYPGHCEIMKILVKDLGLGRRRRILKDVLEHALPFTAQDIVLVFVSATGWRDGQFMQKSFARKIAAQAFQGEALTAIQITTAAAICAMLDLVREGKLKRSGFVGQEEAPLSAFLENRYGSIYAERGAITSGVAA